MSELQKTIYTTPPPVYDELKRLSDALDWLGGRERTRNALMMLALWLKLNDAKELEDIRELLEGTNDNPNITPIPETNNPLDPSTIKL